MHPVSACYVLDFCHKLFAVEINLRKKKDLLKVFLIHVSLLNHFINKSSILNSTLSCTTFYLTRNIASVLK